MKNSITLEVSVGDAIDRAVIEDVRATKTKDSQIKFRGQLLVGDIFTQLRELYPDEEFVTEITDAWDELYLIHSRLWDSEDKVRNPRDEPEWAIIDSYKEITRLNDARAKIKKRINKLYDSPDEGKQHELGD